MQKVSQQEVDTMKSLDEESTRLGLLYRDLEEEVGNLAPTEEGSGEGTESP